MGILTFGEARRRGDGAMDGFESKAAINLIRHPLAQSSKAPARNSPEESYLYPAPNHRALAVPFDLATRRALLHLRGLAVRSGVPIRTERTCPRTTREKKLVMRSMS